MDMLVWGLTILSTVSINHIEITGKYKRKSTNLQLGRMA